MPRLMLSDEYWSKLRPIMRQESIYDKPGLRQTVEGILYRLRAGCPWRDLPKEFGDWNRVYKRVNDGSSKGKVFNIFKSLVEEPDVEWEFVDGSIIRVINTAVAQAVRMNKPLVKVGAEIRLKPT